MGRRINEQIERLIDVPTNMVRWMQNGWTETNVQNDEDEGMNERWTGKKGDEWMNKQMQWMDGGWVDGRMDEQSS